MKKKVQYISSSNNDELCLMREEKIEILSSPSSEYAFIATAGIDFAYKYDVSYSIIKTYLILNALCTNSSLHTDSKSTMKKYVVFCIEI